MALIKADGYNSIRVETGDTDLDEGEKHQLQVTIEELMAAINQENCTDKLFARIMTSRTASHQRLLASVLPPKPSVD